MRDLGDVVIAKVNFRARGSDSGVRIDQLVWQALKFHGGRVTWWAIYQSEAEALEALGAVRVVAGPPSRCYLLPLTHFP